MKVQPYKQQLFFMKISTVVGHQVLMIVAMVIIVVLVAMTVVTVITIVVVIATIAQILILITVLIHIKIIEAEMKSQLL